MLSVTRNLHDRLTHLETYLSIRPELPYISYKDLLEAVKLREKQLEREQSESLQFDIKRYLVNRSRDYRDVSREDFKETFPLLAGVLPKDCSIKYCFTMDYLSFKITRNSQPIYDFFLYMKLQNDQITETRYTIQISDRHLSLYIYNAFSMALLATKLFDLDDVSRKEIQQLMSENQKLHQCFQWEEYKKEKASYFAISHDPRTKLPDNVIHDIMQKSMYE